MNHHHQDIYPACPSGAPYFKGSIRRKLTLFVVTICVVVVFLYWFFSLYMLQPVYKNSIESDLQTMLYTVTDILDKADANGIPIYVTEVRNGRITTRLSDECLHLLSEAERNGTLVLANRCLDISDTNMHSLLLADGLLPRCVLHPSRETGINPEGVEITPERNGAFVTLLRQGVFDSGEYATTLESGQIVRGRTAANGTVSVLVTANIERISQAVRILRRLLFPLSALLVVFSVMAAAVFSHLFTRPIRRLSAAAQEMARGNYDVQVDDRGDDEIAALSKDFNAMAREVKSSTEMQKDLLANVSHDLRTPLTLIKGYAETVRDLTGDDVQKRTEQLDVIVDESDRLNALVGSVLELSKLSSGYEKPAFVLFDLCQLGDEIADRYNAVFHLDGYHISFEGGGRCNVYADPALIERTLHNLLTNALHHVGDDGFVGLKIYPTDHGTVRAEVIDHGPGIDPKDIPYLFDRYYRSRANAGKQGTGLGLSISKAIFTACHFEYGVESELGKGSTFWFEAPLAAP